MLWKKFVIKNFKGIKETTIELDVNGSNIYTIVGLNESGKTTLLEAIDFFGQAVKSHEKSNDIVPVNQDFLKKYSDDLYELIPLPKRISFDEDIEITGYFTITDNDIENICRYCKLERMDKHEYYSITKKYRFIASKHDQLQRESSWSGIEGYKKIEIVDGKKRRSKLRPLEKQEWQDLVNYSISENYFLHKTKNIKQYLTYHKNQIIPSLLVSHF